jgi:hypothetical protein
MLIAALFIIAKSWNQPKWISTNGLRKCEYIYNIPLCMHIVHFICTYCALYTYILYI